ncbi:putative metalloprotease CJM1_0395 family protein [Ferrovibrio sp.]|uniref:putative metalloprotease CJM1_0395 family protein n=1 Tax=Ferrovibrio sp. TaxID=1917215 RepID=UPI00391B33A2
MGAASRQSGRMIGGLSSFSPGSISSYGSAGSFSVATPQSLASDGSAVCQSLECSVHGAALKAQMQAQFPGLKILGGGEPQQAQNRRQGEPPRPVPGSGGAESSNVITLRPGGGSALASGATLLTAQEADIQGSEASGSQASGGAKTAGELSEEEKQQVAKLKQIDAKVRAHERAHAAVGGQYAGAPSYSYTRGPDGQLYAVAGEVPIDIGAESDPEATLQKAAQVAAAALAPADPSGADRAVAAAAQQLRLQALAQIREEKRAEQEAAAAEREEAAANAPALPGQAQEEGAADGAAPAAFGQSSGGQSGSGQSDAGQSDAGQSGRDGPAARAAQAYAPAAEAARASREIGRLVGLVA